MGETRRALELSDAAGGRTARGVSARFSLGRFRRSEDGATAIEYGLIAAMMAVAVILAIGLLTPGVGGLLAGAANAFPDII